MRIEFIILELIGVAAGFAGGWFWHRGERCNHFAALSRATSAENASLVKSQFLANTSHDIRTALSATLGYTDLLHDEVAAGSRAAKWVTVMRRNGQHLLQLLDDILDLSKIEAQRMTIESVDCDLIELLDDVRLLMSARAEEKHLALSIEWAGTAPGFVRTDPTRLRQILINLIANAIKFTDTGGVTLRCQFEQATSAPNLQIDIIDTGVGMTVPQQQRLFEPFTQVDDANARRFGGTGLGLSISRNLARLLGGDIRVQSAQGQGSTFTLTLSVGQVNEEIKTETSTPAIPVAASARLPDSLNGARILLADDGIDNRRMIEFLLTRAGATVVSVEGGDEAVQMALTDDLTQRVDVILMDMEMPTLDGYTATRQLRDKGYLGTIIALTGNAMETEREKCIAAGCDDFIAKPVNRRMLLDKIAPWVAENQGSNESLPRTSTTDSELFSDVAAAAA